jgi:putative membrane protein
MSAWDLLVVAGLTLLGALYLAGRAGLQPAAAARTRVAAVAFWTGWAAMLAAGLPPIDARSLERFSIHMLQHELLMLVGAPLVIAGRPLATALLGLPMRWRRTAAGVLQDRRAGTAWRLVTAPVAAWVVHGAAVWIWHVPALYEGAVRHEALHFVEHATFVGSAALFWSGLVYGRYGRAGYGASVFYVFTTLVHTGLLGAVFTLAPQPLYQVYVERAPDPLGDQQVAGLVMWIPAGLVLTGTGIALFAAWLGDAGRRAAWGRESFSVSAYGERTGDAVRRNGKRLPTPISTATGSKPGAAPAPRRRRRYARRRHGPRRRAPA